MRVGFDRASAITWGWEKFSIIITVSYIVHGLKANMW